MKWGYHSDINKAVAGVGHKQYYAKSNFCIIKARVSNVILLK
jgi:hypothetical protein